MKRKSIQRAKKKIATLTKSAPRSKNNKKKIVIGRVSKRSGRKITKASGVNVTGFRRYISEHSLRHVLNDHGVGKEKDPRNVALTDKDIELIPDILLHADKIGPGHYKGSIRYEKTYSHRHVIIEIIKSSKKKLLELKTMYIIKAT
jgi:hypothetical protein